MRRGKFHDTPARYFSTRPGRGLSLRTFPALPSVRIPARVARKVRGIRAVRQNGVAEIQSTVHAKESIGPDFEQFILPLARRPAIVLQAARMEDCDYEETRSRVRAMPRCELCVCNPVARRGQASPRRRDNSQRTAELP